MARRIDNECAYCADEVRIEDQVIGNDWKVYCSDKCARSGQEVSLREWNRLMRCVSSRREPMSMEQNQ